MTAKRRDTVDEGTPGAERVGSPQTWDTPVDGLPVTEQAGQRLCHLCRSWRPSEHVRDLGAGAVPTCTTCKPDHKIDPRPAEEPALEADRERLAQGPPPQKAPRRKAARA